jgi:hypothetical protein
MIGANDPKATATYGHPKSVASFQFFGPARYGRWLDSRRYRRQQPPNTVHPYPFQPAFGASSAVYLLLTYHQSLWLRLAALCSTNSISK